MPDSEENRDTLEQRVSAALGEAVTLTRVITVTAPRRAKTQAHFASGVRPCGLYTTWEPDPPDALVRVDAVFAIREEQRR
jgi:hypothetical protein